MKNLDMSRLYQAINKSRIEQEEAHSTLSQIILSLQVFSRILGLMMLILGQVIKNKHQSVALMNKIHFLVLTILVHLLLILINSSDKLL